MSKTRVDAEAVPQPARDAVHPALDGDVLAEDEDVVVVRQLVAERLVDGLRQGQRPSGGADAAWPRLGGRGNTSGAITSSRLTSRGSALTSTDRTRTRCRTCS